MPSNCIVPGCRSSILKVRLYTAPYTTRTRWTAWCARCPFLKRLSLMQLQNARFCGKHFLPQYINEKDRLTLDAIPSLMLPEVPELKDEPQAIEAEEIVDQTHSPLKEIAAANIINNKPAEIINKEHTYTSLHKSEEDTQPKMWLGRCCVLCGRRGIDGETKEKVRLYSFPSNPLVCRWWVKYVGLEQLAWLSVKMLHKTMSLCDAHFNPGGFCQGQLCEGIVPSINLLHPPLSDRALEEFPPAYGSEGEMNMFYLLKYLAGIMDEENQSILDQYKSGNVKKSDGTKLNEKDDRMPPRNWYGYRCVLCGKNPEEDSEKTVYLYNFPSDPKLCCSWVRRVGLKKLATQTVKTLHESVFLCGAHFHAGCFTDHHLRGDATPAKNMPYPPLSPSDLANFLGRKMDSTFDKGKENDQMQTNLIGNSPLVSFPPYIMRGIPAQVKGLGGQQTEAVSLEDSQNQTQKIVYNNEADLEQSGDAGLEQTLPPEIANERNDDDFTQEPDNLEGLSAEEYAVEDEVDDTKTLDEIDILFLSYSQTLKNLTSKMQTMLKFDLAKLFARYEMENEVWLKMCKKRNREKTVKENSTNISKEAIVKDTIPSLSPTHERVKKSRIRKEAIPKSSVTTVASHEEPQVEKPTHADTPVVSNPVGINYSIQHTEPQISNTIDSVTAALKSADIDLEMPEDTSPPSKIPRLEEPTQIIEESTALDTVLETPFLIEEFYNDDLSSAEVLNGSVFQGFVIDESGQQVEVEIWEVAG